MVNLATARQSLSDHLAASSSSHTPPPGSNNFTALFLGATSGVGKGTLQQLAQHTHAPRIYLVGRSARAAEPQLAQLRTLNPSGEFLFIETEISLMKNVDRVCEEIKAKEKKVDLLFLSPGHLAFGGREDTAEGIDTLASLQYFARFRAINNLLPLLAAAPAPRVVCVLNGGKESTIKLNDLELRQHYSLLAINAQSTTMTSLALEHLANRFPTVTFIHYYPGFVKTDQVGRFLQTAPGWWAWLAWLAQWTVVPVVSLAAWNVEQAGVMGGFIATSGRYPPREVKGGDGRGGEGVRLLPCGVEVAKSSVMGEGGKRNGVYLLDNYGESAGVNAVLERYRVEKAGERIWKGTEEVWARALPG